jgi:succinate dehydrogenase / fumarate reductase cytochrome b subunit
MSNQQDRPLSPHLQVYGWPITMMTSITHRAMGMVLSLGAIGLSIWLIAAANVPGVFSAVNGVYSTWYGQLLMFLWTYALFYHLCNGIRHLGWDLNVGLDLETARMTGVTVYAAAAVLTIGLWIWAFFA